MSTETPFLLALGKRIRHHREEQKYTQEELAEVSGFDRTYVSLVERGKRNMSILNLRRFALALNISLCELLKEIDGPDSDKSRT